MKKLNKKEREVIKKIFKNILSNNDVLEAEPLRAAEALLKVAYGLKLLRRRNLLIGIARLKMTKNSSDVFNCS